MWVAHFNEAGWKSFRQEIPKCKTLEKVELLKIWLWDCNNKDVAKNDFAVDFAQLLKNSPNILFTNKRNFFYDEHDKDDDDNVLYTTRIAPILEHNRLLKNLAILKRKGNYRVRSFLVAEAVGRRFAQKPSRCYTVLKANVDVLVAYLTSDGNTQQVVPEAVDAPEIAAYIPLLT